MPTESCNTNKHTLLSYILRLLRKTYTTDCNWRIYYEVIGEKIYFSVGCTKRYGSGIGGWPDQDSEGDEY